MGAGTEFLLLPKVPICPDKTNRHRFNYVLALLYTNWLGTHGRIFVVLMVKHQHGNHASATRIIGQQPGPAIGAQPCPSDEAASPVVAEPHSILIFHYHWQIHFAP